MGHQKSIFIVGIYLSLCVAAYLFYQWLTTHYAQLPINYALHVSLIVFIIAIYYAYLIKKEGEPKDKLITGVLMSIVYALLINMSYVQKLKHEMEISIYAKHFEALKDKVLLLERNYKDIQLLNSQLN